MERLEGRSEEKEEMENAGGPDEDMVEKAGGPSNKETRQVLQGLMKRR